MNRLSVQYKEQEMRVRNYGVAADGAGRWHSGTQPGREVPWTPGEAAPECLLCTDHPHAAHSSGEAQSPETEPVRAAGQSRAGQSRALGWKWSREDEAAPAGDLHTLGSAGYLSGHLG